MTDEPPRHWLHRVRHHAVTRTGWRAVLHTSKTVHRIFVVVTWLVIAAAVLLAAGAWRLSQGPLDSLWLAQRVKAALADNGEPVQVIFDTVSLTWDGFRKGAGNPLDLRMTGLGFVDPSGHSLLTADQARLGFSLTDLVLGRIVPRSIEIDHARVTMTRDAAGRLLSGEGADFEALLLPGTDTGQSAAVEIPSVRFNHAELVFRDAASGVAVRSPDVSLQFGRGSKGRIQGTLRAPVFVGNEKTALTATADFTPNHGGTVTLHVGSFRPAALGKTVPLAFLAAADVPVTLDASAALGPDLAPGQMQAAVHFGEGSIHLGTGAALVAGGDAAVFGTLQQIAINRVHVTFGKASDGGEETADLTGTAALTAGRISAALNLSVDHIDAANLGKIWPEGVGGGARPWIVQHILGGIATHGTASVALEGDEDLHDVTVSRATGDLDVANGSFTWINQVPPIEQTEAHLHLIDPDTMDITVSSARQRIGPHNADLMISDGRMHITGLSLKDQIAQLHMQTEGPVASALAILSEPRLKLLSTHPLGLKPTSGDVTTTTELDFPLENKLQVEDIVFRVKAQLAQVAVADHQLTGGTFDLDADRDGLRLKGSASLAQVPVTLAGTMDFTPGTADQVLQKISVTGQPDATQLDAAGLDVSGLVNGPIPMTAVLIERRNGQQSVSLTGDLTEATMDFRPLAWRKDAGTIASASATVQLAHDRVTRIDHIDLRGDGISLMGSADFADGKPRAVVLDSIRLGRTQGHGTIHLSDNGEVGIILQGSRIDLAAKLQETGSGKTEPVTKPDWSLDARFDKADLANGETASNALVRATGSGERIRSLDAVGATAGGATFTVKIAPAGGGRSLSVTAGDAGRFLRGIDAIKGMSGGRLTIDGTLSSQAGFSPIAGKATIEDTVVRNSPVLGKLLQAITLYGLVDVLRGPGMAFPHIAVPFHYDGTDLFIDDALATNPSLGLTGAGRIGLEAGSKATSLSGTIVPAYFFNAIPGQLPLIGKLFSPEKGGGLFAWRFGLTGSISDPEISINPVSGLTPGFLRGIFGIFNKQAAPANGETHQ